MPVVRILDSESKLRNAYEACLKEQLGKIIHGQRSNGNHVQNEIDADQLLAAVEKDIIRQKEACLADYQDMIHRTKDISLEKLVSTGQGCQLFDELCLRIDLNQQYASCLPQWKDVAEQLQVDNLRTQWIQACIRPAEGLTRAVLEIYMKDGGSLGDVLQALLKLECLEILERLKKPVHSYLEAKDNDKNQPFSEKPQFFSVLSTLNSVFGKDEPCQVIQKFAQGLCRVQEQENKCLTTPISHSMLVTGGGEGRQNYDPNVEYPKFDPDVHSARAKEKISKKPGYCRILLLFAKDGLEHANFITENFQGFQIDDMQVDFFRLDESSLWYEVLVNPEACCMKWANEVDYAMPILTPQYLTEIHSGISNDSAPILPTSPVLNRFMYNMLRIRYSDSGCRNSMVRPVLPPIHRTLSQNPAISRDPILRLVYIELNHENLKKRLKSMMAIKN